MTQYLDFFGYKQTGSSTGIGAHPVPGISSSTDNLLPPVFLIYVIGQMIGAPFAGPLCDSLGRRAGMTVGGAIVLIGASIITAAQNRAMFLGGRFVLGFGIAISTTCAPVWVTELAPAHWRGRIGAAYNSEWPRPIAARTTGDRAARAPGRLLLRRRDPCHRHHGRDTDAEQHLGVASTAPSPGMPHIRRARPSRATMADVPVPLPRPRARSCRRQSC